MRRTFLRASLSASEPERDPNVIYAEPIGENSEIIALKLKIKTLEDKVRALTHENIDLRNRIELENSIEKIYENLPSLEQIGETLQNVIIMLEDKSNLLETDDN